MPLIGMSTSTTCVGPECDSPVHNKIRQLCTGHYQQYRKNKPLAPLRKRQAPFCGFADCKRKPTARNLCHGHYRQWHEGRPLSKIDSSRSKAASRPRPKARNRDGYINKHGYRMVWRPESPYATKGRCVQEHRFIMSELLGRKLLPTESVHHKNGVRHDNRLENLELWSKSHPFGQRVEDKVQWAKELLALYEPAALSVA